MILDPTTASGFRSMINHYSTEAETQGTRAPLAPREGAPGLRLYTQDVYTSD